MTSGESNEKENNNKKKETTTKKTKKTTKTNNNNNSKKKKKKKKTFTEWTLKKRHLDFVQTRGLVSLVNDNYVYNNLKEILVYVYVARL